MLGGFLLVLSGAVRADDESRMSWLDNGTLRLGVDLSIGGAITYLAESSAGINMINSHDWGRQIQMSFYSGPNPYLPEGATVNEAWKQLGWNPIQSGDCYGFRSRVLEHRNDGSSVYVRCVPQQWPLKNVPGECTFEGWFRLEGNTVVARSRISNARSDRTQYAARHQELPAVYTNGPWYKLVSYLGDQPFTGAAPTILVDRGDGKGWPWRTFYTPEHWAALLDRHDRGIGVYLPGACRFTGGFAGEPKGEGGPKDSPTGYMTPLHSEILDHNIVYTYAYTLIVGSLQEIRGYVYERSEPDRLPAWTFAADRRHWQLQGAVDTGWPIRDQLVIDLGPGQQAALVSPRTFWRAEAAPWLWMQAAFETDAGEAEVALLPFGPSDASDWPAWGESKKPPPRPEVRISFPIQGDGQMRRLCIDLSSNEAYRGAMTRVRVLLPATDGTARIQAIGFAETESEEEPDA